MTGTSLDLRNLLGSEGDGARPGVVIAGITADSRKVKPGYAFFALKGAHADGRKFIEGAIARGAVAVIGEGSRPFDFASPVAFVRVRDAHGALARAAARFYPRQPRTIVAVTGTNGKTSVASFTRQIWQALGLAGASIGTVGVTSPNGEIKGSLTTPDPVALHALLDRLAGEGVTHAAMEASSHGLEQRRLDGVKLAAGAFTNLTRDHLDYHRTMEAYLVAKLRLFDTLLPEGAGAVVDADHPEASKFADVARHRKLNLVSVGRMGRDLTLLEVVREGLAQQLRVRTGGVEYQMKLPLVGEFQVANALVAAGLAMATGSAAKDVLEALSGLKGASGRLELVGDKDGAPVFVDYAHTPDALENVLLALRPYALGRLLVVFGAGGDRDAGKRPLMGAIAAKRANLVYVTDDNPRTEYAADIRKQILDTTPRGIEIGDREEAIKAAIKEMKAGDVLLVAGKGHETGQIVGERILPFSDQVAIRAALGIRT